MRVMCFAPSGLTAHNRSARIVILRSVLPDPLAAARSLSAWYTCSKVSAVSGAPRPARCRHSTATSPASPRSARRACVSSIGQPAACATTRIASFSLTPNSFCRYSGARRPWIR